jgi:diguanylate cyclase (GGDEF)-like protein
MGIRIKLLLTFILCFGLMATLSMAPLERSMNESYDAIERREIIGNTTRMLQGMEAALAALSSQSADWAVWSAMYDFTKRPDMSWAVDNIGANAMTPAHLSLAMVFDAKGKLLLFNTRSEQGGTLALPNLLSGPYASLFATESISHQPQCGLMKTDAGLMLSCRTRISRNDGSGEFVGNLVLGRLLDQSMILKLREQTQLDFELHGNLSMPQGLQAWPVSATIGSFGSQSFMSAHETKTYHFFYQLQDVLKQNVGILTLDISRDVYAQGVLLHNKVRQLFIWMALGTAVLLGFAVHHLVIRRLRLLTNEMSTLAQESAWHSRIKVSGNDELGQLSSGVNTLLELIEQQVTTLKSLSITDPLTGLHNRREFDARLNLEFARQQRQRQALALLAIDVDYFKAYNDHYGHPAGDLILKELAQIFSAAVSRSGDLVARTGGEEFCILLPDTDAAGAIALAERIRSKLKARNLPHAASHIADYLTVSIGIAIAGDETIDNFVARADQALYRAKREGRDRACFDTDTAT